MVYHRIRKDPNKLVITTIQKLTNAVKKERHSSVMEKIRNKRMIFIYDECHRSQFGDMHKLITGYFTNHQSFGFTGTPIMAENANKGRTTKDLFGDCLHQYVIKDAIDDDNVLGFSVEYFATFKGTANIQDDQVEAIDRQEVIEKYSHAASLGEIVENEYNLNIPRYVDTFEEEEPVDLDAVVAELKSIEAEIGDVDKRIVEQCKELGIPAPVFSAGNR